jgi:cell division protein FtsN
MTASAATRRSSLPRAPQRHSALGGTLIGVFIGIVVGLGLAATVAYWLMKNNPALPMPPLTHASPDPAKDATSKVAKADAEKPRFDFYKILPGVDEPKVQPERRAPDRGDRAVVEQSKGDRPSDKSAPRPLPAVVADTKASEKPAPADSPKAPQKPADRAWLQAGSFSALNDAEGLKARLALAGLEATVQEGALPDKSVRYRVRLGPYDNSDELGRMKSELAKRGFDVAVIRL